MDVMDLVLATNEAATNSLKFGAGWGLLRVWRQDGSLICEIKDDGYFDVESLTNTRPAPERITGRCLWILDEICDVVQISSSPHAGTTVRLHMDIDCK